jgi:hypothetical protein
MGQRPLLKKAAGREPLELSVCAYCGHHRAMANLPKPTFTMRFICGLLT